MKKQHNESLLVKTLPSEFYNLLNKAILYSPKERRTNELLNSCDYNDKQTRLRKSEDILDLQNDKSR